MRDRPVLSNLSPLIPAGDDVDATLAVYERHRRRYEDYRAKDVIHPNGRLDEKLRGTKEFGVLATSWVGPPHDLFLQNESHA
jgi:hypothetical protein